MKTLVVIDLQKDFIDGALSVPDATDAEMAICNYIIDNHKDLAEVLFTVDWHSPHHCSFDINGGEWPIHCIQFSEGAGISNMVINTCLTHDIPIKVFKKGTVDECEEYGAFENIGTYNFINRDGEKDAYISVNNIASSNTQFITTSNIVVCGLAGDYCVKESIKNLLKYQGPLEPKISILYNGIASIDGGESLNNFIEENNLETI